MIDSPPELVCAENYSCTIDHFHLIQNLNMSAALGESIALVGPVGSGKSALLRALVQTFPQPSSSQGKHCTQSGNLTVLGYACSPGEPHPEDVAKMQEQCILLRERSTWLPMSIADNFLAMQKLTAMSPVQKYETIIEKHTRSRHTRSMLLGFANLMPQEVDKPWLQFLALIRALLRAPRILMLDEALISLDPILVKQAESLIAEKNPQMLVLWATNDLYQASRVTDRTLYIASGRLIEDSETPRFFTNPLTREAELFISGRELD